MTGWPGWPARRTTTPGSARSGGRPPGGRWGSAPTTCRCLARWSCCPGTSPRWPPARARPCPARWPPRPTRCAAGRCTCCRSTTTWPAGTPNGCAPSLTCSASRSAASARRRRQTSGGTRTRQQVTYAPVSEIGFDVLRDRFVTDPADLVSADPDVALIDEADSILIDEALVPLVLAGPSGDAQADPAMAEIVRGLVHGLHYEIDDEGRNATLTSAGAHAAEEALGGINLYAADQLDTLTQLNVALHAHALLQRDVDYIVRDGQVHLISASRGRVAQLQRWPDGLQAAVEAKEALAATESGEILDSITIESLVRRYPQVCGMTGTARDRGRGVPGVLRPGGGGDPAEPAVRARGPARPPVREAAAEGEVGRRRGDRRAPGRAAGPDRHPRHRRIGTDRAEPGRGRAAARGAQRQERRAGGRDRGRGRQPRRDHRVDADGRARHRHPPGRARRQRRGPRRDRRAGRALRDRHRPAREQQARRPAPRAVRPPGRPGRLGVLRQPGGRADHRATPRTAAADRATWPPTAGSATLGRTRPWPTRSAWPTARTCRSTRNTFRFNKLIEEQRRIVLEHRDRMLRTDAADRALASRCPERLRRARGRRSTQRCWPGPRGRSSCTTSTAAGPTTWPRWPGSARASTCARSGRGRTRSAWRWTRWPSSTPRRSSSSPS